MESPRHPYRKLSCAAVAEQGDTCLLSADDGSHLRLSRRDYDLALLFDGQRDAAEILARATGLGAGDAQSLERFALRLSEAGVLAPGRREALPIAPQSDAYPAFPEVPEVLLPSTFPGTLTAPALTGSLTGLWGRKPGETAALQTEFDLRRWLPLGDALNFPLRAGARLWLLIALSIGCMAALANHRFELGRDLLRLLPLTRALLVAVLAGYACNFLAELARAAAIARGTRSRPRFGLTSGLFGLPHFHVDTAGAAEAASRAARLRIVGAPLACALSLFVSATVVWLMFEHHGGLLAPLATGCILVFGTFLLLQINPLAKRTGYHLLIQSLQSGDLREHAGYALFGQRRPWSATRPLPARWLRLYAVLVVAYMCWFFVWLLILPGAWLKAHWGPVAVFVIAAGFAYLGYRVLRRAITDRSHIGENLNVSIFDDPVKWAGEVWQGCRDWLHRNRPGRRGKIIIALVALICLFPYPYDPSGDFIVLPNARADVRAQIAGEVRKVFVKEGDAVKAGDPIAQLADEDEKAQLAAAQAELAKLEADLALAKQGRKPEEIEQARQEVNTAAKRYQFSREEANRLSTAFQRKAVSEQDYKRSLSQAEVNQQQLLEAQKHLSFVGSAATDQEIKGLEAQVARQKSLADYQQTQLDYATLRAPIAGRVVSASLQFAVGSYLQRGDSLARVDESDHLQVEIRVTEDDIDQIRLGSRAWAKAWSVPGSAYAGKIVGIAPSAQDEKYGRVVRVYMDIDQPDGRLRPEMTGYAKIRGHWYPLIVSFTRPVFRFVMVEMWSWLP